MGKTKSSKKTTQDRVDKKAASLQQTIIEASALSEQITALTLKLEDLKQVIRQHAIPMITEGENNVKIETVLGKCIVSLQRSHLVIAPGADPDVLKLTLERELWNTFFVMKPAFRQTATDAWLRMSEEQRSKLGVPSPFELAPRLAQVKLPK